MNGKQKLPNIVLIVMDTAGAKHMSLYGYPRTTTPNLERLAGDCTVYNRCFSPACWTIPSHASMFTGLYPSQHGAHEGHIVLSDNIQHLVPVLKMAGYRTYGISQNLLVSPPSGLCRDFDYFKQFAQPLGFGRFHHLFNPGDRAAEEGILKEITEVLTTKERIKVVLKYFRESGEWVKGMKDVLLIVNYQIKRYINPSPYQKSSRYAPITISLVKNILEQMNASNNDQPYFLFINLIEAHEKYRPPLAWRRFSRWHDKQNHRMHSFYEPDFPQKTKLQRVYQNLYDDEILYLDHVVHRLWDLCRQYPGFDNTAFIITSDHGEHFGEKDLYGHILSLYNELIWVPLIVKYPQGTVAKGINDRLVCLTDLYATILDLGNIPIPSPRTSFSLANGTSRNLAVSQMITQAKFWDAQLKAKQAGSRLAGSEFRHPRVAIMTAAGKKIIEKHDGSLEVYSLHRDLDETRNLAGNLTGEELENLRNLVALVREDTGYDDTVKQLEKFADQDAGDTRPFLEVM